MLLLLYSDILTLLWNYYFSDETKLILTHTHSKFSKYPKNWNMDTIIINTLYNKLFFRERLFSFLIRNKYSITLENEHFQVRNELLYDFGVQFDTSVIPYQRLNDGIHTLWLFLPPHNIILKLMFYFGLEREIEQVLKYNKLCSECITIAYCKKHYDLIINIYEKYPDHIYYSNQDLDCIIDIYLSKNEQKKAHTISSLFYDERLNKKYYF